MGMRTDGIVTTTSGRTAVCNMVIDESGSLVGGVADMDIIKNLSDAVSFRLSPLMCDHSSPSLQDLSQMLNSVDTSGNPIVAVDANLSSKALSAIITHCNKHNLRSKSERYTHDPLR